MGSLPAIKSVNVYRNLWQTPKDVYSALDAEFHFDFDPCSTYPIMFDGLAVEWGRSHFINPPFEKYFHID